MVKIGDIMKTIMKDITFINSKILIIKRIIDLSVSVICLIISLPLFLNIAILIKLTSKGSIFYVQRRVGVILPNQTKYFNMIKFRTMKHNAESETGAVWASENDDRLTYVGKALRKTRLDELPQFINVIKGEMSIIGPRPERPEIAQKLEEQIPFYFERTFWVTPGITGLAQVYQGYDKSVDDVRAKIAYDFAYSLSLTKLHQWLLMDLKIVLRTFAIMILGRGQ